MSSSEALAARGVLVAQSRVEMVVGVGGRKKCESACSAEMAAAGGGELEQSG